GNARARDRRVDYHSDTRPAELPDDFDNGSFSELIRLDVGPAVETRHEVARVEDQDLCVGGEGDRLRNLQGMGDVLATGDRQQDPPDRSAGTPDAVADHQHRTVGEGDDAVAD